MRRHALPIRWYRFAAVAATALVVALSSGCSRIPLDGILKGVIHPSIEPSATEQGTRDAKVGFPFEGSTVELGVPVDSAVYAGAVNAEKNAIFIGGDKPPNWVSDYYRAFIEEEHQSPFYDALASALHKVRDEKGLDSARYVELVAAMAQNLDYRVDPGNLAPKFPIETFTDGYGDCDDKALLAAAVLSRDGYDVAVLFFGKEEHVALGVRAPGLEYKDTGYGYLEMTEASFVGMPPEKLAGDIELESDPLVIPIGEGDGEYGAGEQIRLIQDKLRQMKSERDELERRIQDYTSQLASQRASLDSDKARLDAVGPGVNAGDIDSYNRRVNSFNELVARADTAVARYNALLDLEKYAIQHRNDRPQVYSRMRSN